MFRKNYDVKGDKSSVAKLPIDELKTVAIEICVFRFGGGDYCLDTLKSFGDILLDYKTKIYCLENILR
jgi:hypothetical protein